MIIDCGTCAVRGDACAECVVSFLTIPVRARTEVGEVAVELDAAEQGAIDVLACSGLVPPLRLRQVG